jgi:Cu/Ag efflux pump CusA
MYIYVDKFIFGINISFLEFIGNDIEKITKKIKNASDVVLEREKNHDQYKHIIDMLDNQVKYIPILHFKNYGKTNSAGIVY